MTDKTSRAMPPCCAAAGTALPKPPWVRVRLPGGGRCAKITSALRSLDLNTVCESALCPNRGECWRNGRVTIMLLGDKCTRRCRFCAVSSQKPQALDADEPRRVFRAVRKLGIVDVVLTSVTRDDLPDGGAGIWARTIRSLRTGVPACRIEALIPDFDNNSESLRLVFESKPDVLGHNLETVPSLYRAVRPRANYEVSLGVLEKAHRAGLIAKTALMLGLGETPEEVRSTMADARKAGCDIFCLGQYLQPTPRHAPVLRYAPPEEFESLKQFGLALGFHVFEAGPLIRSSYYSPEQAAFVRTRCRPNISPAKTS